jgi:hypothetical protein
MARSTILIPASWSALSPFSDLIGASAQQGYAAAWHDAFFHGSAGSVQCIFNAGFFSSFRLRWQRQP